MIFGTSELCSYNNLHAKFQVRLEFVCDLSEQRFNYYVTEEFRSRELTFLFPCVVDFKIISASLDSILHDQIQPLAQHRVEAQKTKPMETFRYKRIEAESAEMSLYRCIRAPRLVDIRWTGPTKPSQSTPKVALVGKGVAFDTGGLDIKPSQGMKNMKKVMYTL